MLHVLIFIVCLLSSTAGGICGIGGGVIIKPVVDALGVLSVSALSFLSGLTVLSMSCISVYKQRKRRLVDMKTGTPLALGAAVGGLAGKAIFDVIKTSVGEAPVGLIQSIALGIITLLTLLYMMHRAKITTHNVKSPVLCAVIGLLLGVMSSFLGIGGGPINLCVLYFFFSMDTKKAAANSLYVILFSQAASALSTVAQGKIPEFSWLLLILMVAGGVLGGMLGHKLNEKLSAKQVDKLFVALLVLIILICVYNAFRFAGMM
ncbi:MAG: sulfite exporter TauE/SafE family protein [Clostridia bacterium]|nr:sulfite exporter TauE/SafE family protein [Clostridia bacterium]